MNDPIDHLLAQARQDAPPHDGSNAAAFALRLKERMADARAERIENRTLIRGVTAFSLVAALTLAWVETRPPFPFSAEACIVPEAALDYAFLFAANPPSDSSAP